MTHLLEIVQTVDTSLQLAWDVQDFQCAFDEGLILRMTHVQSKLQRLFSHDGGDEERDANHTQRSTDRHQHQGTKVVLSWPVHTDGIIHHAGEQVARLHKCLEVHRDISRDAVIDTQGQVEVCTERGLATLLKSGSVAAHATEHTREPVRDEHQDEDGVDGAHLGMLLEAPHGVRCPDEVPHPHKLDGVEQRRDVKHDDGSVCQGAEPLHPIHGICQPSGKDGTPIHHLCPSTRMHERGVEPVQEKTAVQDIHAQIEAQQTFFPWNERRLLPIASPQECQRRDNACEDDRHKHYKVQRLRPPAANASKEPRRNLFILVHENQPFRLQQLAAAVVVDLVIQCSLQACDGILRAQQLGASANEVPEVSRTEHAATPPPPESASLALHIRGCFPLHGRCGDVVKRGVGQAIPCPVG
mmetsp:Transcript_64661/g.171168  ORF Transcript_64661/g.171168 Transcript_64661/m.171168 type:complete len:413 (-) Transcript_64661:265-1503(-)